MLNTKCSVFTRVLSLTAVALTFILLTGCGQADIPTVMTGTSRPVPQNVPSSIPIEIPTTAPSLSTIPDDNLIRQFVVNGSTNFEASYRTADYDLADITGTFRSFSTSAYMNMRHTFISTHGDSVSPALTGSMTFSGPFVLLTPSNAVQDRITFDVDFASGLIRGASTGVTIKAAIVNNSISGTSTFNGNDGTIQAAFYDAPNQINFHGGFVADDSQSYSGIWAMAQGKRQ